MFTETGLGDKTRDIDCELNVTWGASITDPLSSSGTFVPLSVKNQQDFEEILLH